MMFMHESGQNIAPEDAAQPAPVPVMRIDDEVLSLIAQDAGADQRSVLRRLVGLHVRGRAGQRIDDAIARHLGPPSGGAAGEAAVDTASGSSTQSEAP